MSGSVASITIEKSYHIGQVEAFNTIATPNAVSPQPMSGTVQADGQNKFQVRLSKASWNVIRFFVR